MFSLEKKNPVNSSLTGNERHSSGGRGRIARGGLYRALADLGTVDGLYVTTPIRIARTGHGDVIVPVSCTIVVLVDRTFLGSAFILGAIDARAILKVWDT